MSMASSFSNGSGLVPGRNSLLETQLIANIISAIAYGFVLFLAIDCFRLLFDKNSRVPSRSTHRFLVAFTSFLLLLSTLSLIQGALIVTTSIFGQVPFPSLSGGAPYVLPISIWSSDGFMLWRCSVLYQGVSRTARVSLLSFISLVFIASLGSGFSLFSSPLTGRLFTLLIVSFSTLFNITICLLIVGRLIFHQRYLKTVLGPGHGSPYTRIMAVTVESAALLILLGIPYGLLVTYQNVNGSMFILTLLPHICSMSPMLIISRVARGRAAMKMPLEGGPDMKDIEVDIGSLHFKTITVGSLDSSEHEHKIPDSAMSSSETIV